MSEIEKRSLRDIIAAEYQLPPHVCEYISSEKACPQWLSEEDYMDTLLRQEVSFRYRYADMILKIMGGQTLYPPAQTSAPVAVVTTDELVVDHKHVPIYEAPTLPPLYGQVPSSIPQSPPPTPARPAPRAPGLPTGYIGLVDVPVGDSFLTDSGVRMRVVHKDGQGVWLLSLNTDAGLEWVAPKYQTVDSSTIVQQGEEWTVLTATDTVSVKCDIPFGQGDGKTHTWLDMKVSNLSASSVELSGPYGLICKLPARGVVWHRKS